MSPPGEERLGPHAWESAVEDLIGLGRRKFSDFAGPARDDFATTLFGSIVWPKSLGRPDAADAAAGFEVTSVCMIEKHDSPGGPVLGELLERVLVAEEASETDEYVVRIVTAYHATTEVPTP